MRLLSAVAYITLHVSLYVVVFEREKAVYVARAIVKSIRRSLHISTLSFFIFSLRQTFFSNSAAVKVVNYDLRRSHIFVW